jgi:hypothetical protein
VVGQCLFYFYARPIILRLHPEQLFGPADIEALARHITGFCPAALRCPEPPQVDEVPGPGGAAS